MKILPVASGSTGNCMLVEMGSRRILIDLGVTASALRSALEKNGYSWSDIDAVLITHTHSDHVKGMDVCLKRIAAPVFMSHTSKDVLQLDRATALTYGARAEILPDLWVTAIRISHDCPGSIGFKIESPGNCFGYLTDLGCIPAGAMELLYGSSCIVIESNHDEEMLNGGPYPEYLKRRILSSIGHLSNKSCGEALVANATANLRRVWLCHLSEENNHPELARKTVDSILRSAGIVPGVDFQLDILKRKMPSEVIELL